MVCACRLVFLLFIPKMLGPFYKSVRRLLSDQVIAAVDSQLAKLLEFGYVELFGICFVFGL